MSAALGKYDVIVRSGVAACGAETTTMMASRILSRQLDSCKVHHNDCCRTLPMWQCKSTFHVNEGTSEPGTLDLQVILSKTLHTADFAYHMGPTLDLADFGHISNEN